MAVNYGSKRTVVGASYGFKDWLSQRATAVLMALFTVLVVIRFLLITGPVNYVSWAGVFAPQAMKVITFTVILALCWHVWVGVRDIYMDYIKPVSIRLSLQVATIVYLIGCAGWAIQVLWRI